MYIEDKRITQARAQLCGLQNKLASKTDKSLADNYRKIIEVICDYYRNDASKILKVGMRQRDRVVRASEEDILRRLEAEGILCTHESFKPIGDFIRKLRNAVFGKNVAIESVTPESLYGTFCFENVAALNTYDYRRLLEEVDMLMDKCDISELSSLSPTLAGIFEEKETSGIPGRLPYNYKYPSETMRRYQRLRILDDILAETEIPLSNTDIITKLQSRLAEECGIDKICRQQEPGTNKNDPEKDVTLRYDGMLKNDFTLLDNLISIETHHGEKQAFERKGVYDLRTKGRRKYLTDVRAFELVITDREANRIYRELLHCKPLQSKKKELHFSWRFPMLEALQIYGRSYISPKVSKLSGLKTEKQSGSPIYTADYYGPDESYIYREAERMVNEKRPLVLSPLGDAPRLYYPLSIKQNGSKWVMIALDSLDKRLHSLTPEHIKTAIENDYTENQNIKEFFSEYLVGLSAPDEGFEYYVDVTLTLTLNGYKNLVNSRSYSIVRDSVQNGSLFGDDCQRNLNITVYLNEDFYQDLKWQANHENLIDIYPAEAKQWFEDRYKRDSGGYKEWSSEAGRKKALNGKISRSTKGKKNYASDECGDMEEDSELEAWNSAKKHKDLNENDLNKICRDDLPEYPIF